MDLDSILGILFFVVFVVVPLFTNASRRGQGRGAKGAGQGRAQGTGTGQAAAGDAPDQVPMTLAEIRRRVEEAQRREEELAKARRARGRQPAEERPGSLVTGDPFEGSLVSTPARRLGESAGPSASLGPMSSPATGQTTGGYVLGPEGGVPGSFPTGDFVLGREGAQTPRRPSDGSLGREGAAAPRPPKPPTSRGAQPDRSARAAASEIGRASGARPAKQAGKATLSRTWALRTDEESILNGLIWHEVLSRPKALRHWRER